MDLDADAIARACNADPRFLATRWRESAHSVSQLLASSSFRTFMLRVTTHGRTRIPALVAAVYACREAERSRKAGIQPRPRVP